MSTQDISRNAFDSKKHYSSVRIQQGRVSTDDDWNENNRIHEEVNRRALVDVVGAAASPDQGFLISNPVKTNGVLDFTINAGTFYLGGRQLSLESDQTYRSQDDWLQGLEDINSTNNERVDLVYLETYQQVVSAVEDNELYEVALGGADTATRLKTMQRVHVRQGVGTGECSSAWQSTVNHWSDMGSLENDHELKPDVTMEVDFTDEGDNGDLCNPVVAGGFLGAENQTIRVQLRDDQTFTWGFDNVAPLYRVTLSADRRTVTLVTPPKDQYHWPQAEQTIEILAWGAVLPNGEKVAEYEGFLTKVSAGYDPNTGAMTLDDAVPTQGFDDWQKRADEGELNQDGPYFYMRVWNRGSDLETDSAISFTSGDEVSLGFTGLTVSFNGTQFNSGDYWIITARPSAPEEIVPWSLQVNPGRDRIGIKKYYAPMALLKWDQNGSVSVLDCRRVFMPLSEQRCCIKLVATPGPGWHHIFEQIPDRGDAVICLPPGDYPLSSKTTISNKCRLTIVGAGKTSRIYGFNSSSLLSFETCDHVDMRDLYIFGGNRHRSRIRGTLAFDDVKNIDLSKLAIRCKGGKKREMACVRINNTYITRDTSYQRINISDCDFYVGQLQTGILIVNSNYVNITNNRLIPSGITTKDINKSLKERAYLADLAQSSILSDIGEYGSRKQQITYAVDKDEVLTFYSDQILKPYWDNYISENSQKLSDFNQGMAGIMRVHLKNHMKMVLKSRTRRESTPEINEWLTGFRSAQAYMGQGIVIVGRRATYVNIANNDIGNSAQGIHVGLSHKTANRSESAAFIADDIFIKENKVKTYVGPGGTMERHACFIGNVNNAMVADNTFILEKKRGLRHIVVEAIRVFGFLGDMVRIYGNRAQGYATTANIVERGPISGSDLRVSRENFPEM